MKNTEAKAEMTVITLTASQKAALERLRSALTEATDSGLLDLLQPCCDNPDSINDVCDSVSGMIDLIARA